jgi:hypothetical protein
MVNPYVFTHAVMHNLIIDSHRFATTLLLMGCGDDEDFCMDVSDDHYIATLREQGFLDVLKVGEYYIVGHSPNDI